MSITKEKYIKNINDTLNRINSLDSLACIWLYVDVLAEREVWE